ncbi:hypothetical protein Cni_G07352 [Canna indica]|uniref:J domain-containing protein n=1 Tax=Canna indica TaxID=4628 RepID=A0AAQ3Q4T8_9LILI|nr:hypothetical protein Cni_G07352 [Canna indica]
MDGNRDEALKCLQIGKDALGSGDRARALKFLSKARRLDPTLPIDDLLSTAASVDGEPGGSDESAASSDCSRPERPSKGASSSSAAEAVDPSSSSKARASLNGSGSSRGYTEGQVAVVKHVMKQDDYYQILGLEKGCAVEEVGKAYRKLSLKVHPDKNKAPGAEEAFKAVSKAFQCLNNEESRKRYDLVGSDEPAHVRPGARRRNHGFNGFNDDEFDADEIFRNFFGRGPSVATPYGTFRFRAGGMGGPSVHEMHGSANSNLRMLIQVLPVIILLLLNFLPSSEPIYTLSRSYPFEHKLQTPRGVVYFVKSVKFEEEYPYQSQKRIALEEHVERDYVGILTQNCRVELQRRQWGMSYQTPHCDMLQKFKATA